MNVNASELHNRLLQLFKRLDAICRDNNIRYYMLGGTCLGAIRHQGFIPWDDDVDVGMPREDYDRFIGLSQDELGDGVEIRYYGTTSYSPFHFAKYIDTNTTLIERKYRDYVEGLYIDVFPLDNVPNHSVLRRMFFHAAHLLQSLIVNHCSTDEDGGTSRRLYRFMAKRINLGVLHAALESVMTCCRRESTEYIGNVLGSWGLREIMPRSVLGTPAVYKFEDSFFFGPEHPSDYLVSLYDEWQVLPPPEKRVWKHDYYFIDLNLPYLDYIRLHRY